MQNYIKLNEKLLGNLWLAKSSFEQPSPETCTVV